MNTDDKQKRTYLCSSAFIRGCELRKLNDQALHVGIREPATFAGPQITESITANCDAHQSSYLVFQRRPHAPDLPVAAFGQDHFYDRLGGKLLQQANLNRPRSAVRKIDALAQLPA